MTAKSIIEMSIVFATFALAAAGAWAGDALPGDAVEISSGFYQSAATYAGSTDFYITSVDGLKHFRDMINADANGAVTDYLTKFPGSAANVTQFYSGFPFSGRKIHLLSDIDLAGEAWSPIGLNKMRDGTNPSYDHACLSAGAVFDGHDHVISNLAFDDESCNAKFEVGLFGRFYNATVRNVRLQNVNIKANRYVGALVGNAGSATTTVISNCHVSGSIYIKGNRWMGGLAGHGQYFMTNCSVVATSDKGTIEATAWQVGGLAGTCRPSTIVGCRVENMTVKASSSGQVGGIIGNLIGTVASCEVSDVDIVCEGTAKGQIVGNCGNKTDYPTTISYVLENSPMSAGQCGTMLEDPVTVVGWNIAGEVAEGGVTGGTFESLPDTYVAAGYAKLAQGTTPETWVVGIAPNAVMLARDGVTIASYDTIAEALDAYNFSNNLQTAGTYVMTVTGGVETASVYEVDNAEIRQSTIKILTIKPADGQKVTLKFPASGAYSYKRIFNIYGGSIYSTENVIFDGLAFDLSAGAEAIHFLGEAGKDQYSTDRGYSTYGRYSSYVTVKNCSFAGGGDGSSAIASPSGSQPSAIVVTNCVCTDVGYLVSSYASPNAGFGFKVYDCHATNCKAFFNQVDGSGTTEIRNCSAINHNDYSVRANAAITISNCAFTNNCTTLKDVTEGAIVVLRTKSGSNGVLTISDTTFTDLSADGYTIHDLQNDMSVSTTITANGTIDGLVFDNKQFIVAAGKFYDFHYEARIGDTNFVSLADAYAVAQPGDTVELLVDTIERIDTGIPVGVTVEGIADKTVVTGNNQFYGITLNNVTLRNFKFTADSTNRMNGAIRYAYLTGGSTFTLENCEFDQNPYYSLHFDGNANGHVIAKNTIFRDTVALATGIEAEFNDCQFRSNSHYEDIGISLYTDTSLSNCVFDANYAACSAEPDGGLYLKANNIVVTLTDCSVEGEGNELTDVFKRLRLRSYSAVGVINGEKDGEGKYTSGTFITSSLANLNAILADDAKIAFLKSDNYANTFIYEVAGSSKTVTAEGTLKGEISVPSGLTFQIENEARDKATITAGTKIYLPVDHAGAEYNEWVASNITAAQAANVAVYGYQVRIGETKYQTIHLALAAVQDGETITLLTSNYSDSAIAFDANKAYVFDLNGYTLKGDVTVTDGALTLTNGNLRAVTDGAAAVTVAGGAFTLADGAEVKGAIGVAVNSGSFYSVGGKATATNDSAVVFARGVTATVAGGTFMAADGEQALGYADLGEGAYPTNFVWAALDAEGAETGYPLFNTTIPASYIAETYKLKDNLNGTWTVTAGSPEIKVVVDENIVPTVNTNSVPDLTEEELGTVSNQVAAIQENIVETLKNPENEELTGTGVATALTTTNKTNTILRDYTYAALTNAAPEDVREQITTNSTITSYVKIDLKAVAINVSTNSTETETRVVQSSLNTISYDIKPVVTTVISNSLGEVVTVKAEIPEGTVLAEPITFRLWLEPTFPSKIGTVTHKHGETVVEAAKDFIVRNEDDGTPYIDLTWSQFSTALIEARSQAEYANKACWVGTDTGSGELYDTIAEALAAAETSPNAQIWLLKDNSETVALGDNQTIYLDGHAFTGTLTAIDGTEMVRSADGETVYRAPEAIAVPTGATTSMKVRGYTDYPGTVTTKEQKAAYLAEEDEYGRPRWQTYILGANAKVVPEIVASADPEVSKVVIRAANGFTVSTPAKAGVCAKFNLLTKAVGEPTFVPYVEASETPSFQVDVKEISAKTLWKIQTVFESTEE